MRATASSTRFWFELTAVLVTALLIRLVDLGADAPTDVSRDFSLSTDASWYSAAALDETIGRECDVGRAYDKPLYTAYLRALYSAFGPSLWTTNLASVPLAVVAVLLTALAARRLWGDAGGVLAAVLLALNYSFVVFNRSAVPYTLLALIASAVLYLCVTGATRQRLAPVLAAWVICAAGIVLVKEILVILVPMLLACPPIPSILRRRPRIAAAGLVATAVAAVGVGLALGLHHSFAQKLHDYFVVQAKHGVAWRLLSFEDRAGVFRALPVVLPLALFAPLLRRLRAVEWSLVAALIGGLLLFATAGYSPLRYLVVLFPTATVLAAGTLAMLFQRPAPEGVPHGAVRWAVLPVALFFAYQLCRAFATDEAVILIGWVGLAVVVVAIAARMQRFLPPVLTRHTAWIGVVCVFVALGSQVLRTSSAFAARYSTQHALTEIDTIVADDAVLSGLFSHLLTTESRLDRQLVSAVRFGKGALRREYEQRGITHLTIDVGEHTQHILRRFAVDGAPLVPVHEFIVRGTRVLLLRFEHAAQSYRPSDYETAVDAMREGDRTGATELLERHLAAHPDSAATHSALAECLLTRGDRGGALAHSGAALEANPYDLRAAGIRTTILLDAGELHEALELMRWIRRIDPASAPQVERTIRQVERDLAKRGAAESTLQEPRSP